MPYIFAIIAAVSFASGFGVSYQISKAQIQRKLIQRGLLNALHQWLLQKYHPNLHH